MPGAEGFTVCVFGGKYRPTVLASALNQNLRVETLSPSHAEVAGEYCVSGASFTACHEYVYAEKLHIRKRR